MHRQRNIYQSRMLDLLRTCLSEGQDGGCKQRGQTATIWLKALLMPRLAVCSRDLHWHWINWTLLCDTMEVSMLRLAWLPIAQHVFQPALTMWQVGSSWFREKLSPANRNKGYRGEQISRKIVSRELNARSYRNFVKNIVLLGGHVCKIGEIGGQKNGVQHATTIYPIPRYTRPRYIGLTLYSKFHIWPWKFKVKVMAKVKPDGHIWGLEFNLCLLFISWQLDHFCKVMAKVKPDDHIWGLEFNR